jgi:hypothetical protein
MALVSRRGLLKTGAALAPPMLSSAQITPTDTAGS